MQGICMEFPGVKALDNVDLVLKQGEIHAIVGENGAGKSTLIKVLAGAYRPTAGRVFIDGAEVHIADPRHGLACGIGVVYQDRALVPSLTAVQNILLGREPARLGVLDGAAMRAQAEEALNMMGVSVPLDVPVGELSAGDQQLVEIAKIALLKPRIMVLDEPTAALSDREIECLFGLLRRFREQGIGIIYISHHLNEVFELADTVTVLRNGGVAGTGPVSGFTTGDVIRLMIDRDLSSQYVKEPVDIGNEVLRTEALTCRRIGVHDVSISVRAGEIVGLGGLMGAGRSELASLIFGAVRPDSGRVLVDGRDVTPKSVRQAIKAGIYLVPEKRREFGLVAVESIMSNMTLPFLRDFVRMGVVGTAAERGPVEKLMGELRVKARKATDPVATLSGGNQQKVVIAKWLAKAGRVFIFDEPTQGIDVGAKTEVYQMMLNLARAGAGVILISSDLRELVAMSDRVYVMRAGRLAGEVKQGEVDGEAVLRYALGGV
jgi:ribose transport system ATP-binding protein